MTPQEQIFLSKFVERAKSTTGINGFEIFDKQVFQRDDGTIGFAREDGSLRNSDKIVETITLNGQNIYKNLSRESPLRELWDERLFQ